MSSILRALKKLDEDSTAPEGQTGQDSAKIKMRRMVQRGTGTSRRINRVLAISSVLLLAITAALIIMKLNWNQPITKEQETAHKKPALTQLPPQPRSRPPAKETIPPAITVEQSKPSTIPASPLNDSPPRPEEVKVEKKTYPGFILTGILWSHMPGRRVALINDRYLKEGDEIDDGVSIILIEKKTVTLQSGEEKWTLRLKK